MKLVESQARFVRLEPVAYEFPGNAEADWIVVDGDASEDERCWDFNGAVLVEADLEPLSEWLIDVAAGRVLPTGIDDDPSLTFIEPSLAFSLSFCDTDLIGLRIHLTHWFSPPWLDPDEVLSTYTYFVELSMAPVDIEAAASQWRSESAALLNRRL